MLTLIAALACPPPSLSIPQVVQIAENKGGAFIDLVDVNGDGFDQVLVVDYGGSIMTGTFSHGCAVSSPMWLGAAARRTGV